MKLSTPTTPITPEIFGKICMYAARGRAAGESLAILRASAPLAFSRVDADDLADALEGAVEQWDRLQVKEPTEAEAGGENQSLF
jgi:hypothetical protein